MPSAGNVVRARPRGLRLTSQVLLAIQVLWLGHLLLVRHVTCPEHGDIMHVAHSSAASPARADARPGVVRNTVAARRVVDGDHDHCLGCLNANRRFALAPPAVQTLADLSVAVVAVHVPETVPFAPLDPILLSPKNSPPIA